MSETEQNATPDKALSPKPRSPKYPYISLDVAIERVATIYAGIKGHAQPREVVAKVYGKPATSSATIQTFATLLQYGLLENVTEGDTRRMQVSRLARDLLHPHAPEDKIAAAKKTAALSPPIFAELWGRYGNAADVADGVPLYYLTRDRETEHGAVFTERAAEEVLRVYRTTIAFAGLGGSDNVPEEPPEEGENAGDKKPDAAHDTGSGSRTPSNAEKPPVDARRTDMTSSERELQTGLLSRQGATYRIIVSGHIGAKEIGRLIERLKLDQKMLEDEETGEPSESAH